MLASLFGSVHVMKVVFRPIIHSNFRYDSSSDGLSTFMACHLQVKRVSRWPYLPAVLLDRLSRAKCNCSVATSRRKTVEEAAPGH